MMVEAAPAVVHVQQEVNQEHRRDPSFTCAAYALEKASELMAMGYQVRLVMVLGLSEPHAVVSVQDPASGEWMLDSLQVWPQRRSDLQRIGYRFEDR